MLPCQGTFVKDAAFPLHDDLLHPYAPSRSGPMDEPEKIFNYHLSHACRVVENAFGILAQRFRLYHRKLSMTHEHTKQIVQATTVLHNFIICETDIDMNAVQEKDIKPYTGGMLETLPPLKGNNSTEEGMKARHKYRNYFLSDVGSVKWQSNYTHLNLADCRYSCMKVKKKFSTPGSSCPLAKVESKFCCLPVLLQHHIHVDDGYTTSNVIYVICCVTAWVGGNGIGVKWDFLYSK